MKLYEKVRPKTWADLVGQDKAKATILSRLRLEGWNGQTWWLAGNPGTGKTSAAYLIAREKASPMDILEVDADKVGPDFLDQIREDAGMSTLWGKGRAYIVNEAHGLRANIIRGFLVLLEEIAADNRAVCIIFTTTKAAQGEFFEAKIDAGALMSRCNRVSFTNQGLCAAFVPRLREIAREEGLGELDEKTAESIIRGNDKKGDQGNNLRDAVQRLVDWAGTQPSIPVAAA